ncbi:PP2C family serine/threonine-protein phosphatase [Campylobacter gastrosuis]|uniref:Protein phosphatase 2C domain-containing protein n=1 Tax=Campylobacter gastrosuis TaxID=2974576 RepID=A0ABT7HPY3_9BACT|nr:PP2C family serine/threonine-protein phosphatase [Campylobacter gastrosuis]MDL0088683.1 protein phosphatase 2C domain-containing protein [Campylobacter gastrosuis]
MHIKNNTPCQDKISYINKENLSIIALSDGAGSAKLSHLGAENSVNFVCNEFAQSFDYYFEQTDASIVKTKIINKINDNITQLSKKHNCDISAFAHTLLFVVIKDDNFILFHIGDGVIGCLKNGNIEVASKPTNDEFANVTVFTTSPNAMQNTKLIKGKMLNIDGFVLMSDGSERSFYDKKSNKLAKILERLLILNSILPNMALHKKLINIFKNSVLNKTNDDCSFLMISKKSKFSEITDEQKFKIFGSCNNKNYKKRSSF